MAFSQKIDLELITDLMNGQLDVGDFMLELLLKLRTGKKKMRPCGNGLVAEASVDSVRANL